MSYMRQRVLTHDRWVFGGVFRAFRSAAFQFVHTFLCVPSTLLHFFIESSLFMELWNKRIESNT